MIDEVIKAAKIGRERKDAQVETCAVFGAALYDVLIEYGYSPSMVVVGYRGGSVATSWYHQVVEVDGKMYDSLGEFSTDILRNRLKISDGSNFDLKYEPDSRAYCYDEDDYQVLYEFLVKELRKAALKVGLDQCRPALAC